MHIFHDANRWNTVEWHCIKLYWIDNWVWHGSTAADAQEYISTWLPDWMTLVPRLVSIILLHWSLVTVSVVLCHQNSKPDKHKSLEWQKILTTVENKSENKSDLEVKILRPCCKISRRISVLHANLCYSISMPYTWSNKWEYMLRSRPFHSISSLCWVTDFHKMDTYLW